MTYSFRWTPHYGFFQPLADEEKHHKADNYSAYAPPPTISSPFVFISPRTRQSFSHCPRSSFHCVSFHFRRAAVRRDVWRSPPPPIAASFSAFLNPPRSDVHEEPLSPGLRPCSRRERAHLASLSRRRGREAKEQTDVEERGRRRREGKNERFLLESRCGEEIRRV